MRLRLSSFMKLKTFWIVRLEICRHSHDSGPMFYQISWLHVDYGVRSRDSRRGNEKEESSAYLGPVVRPQILKINEHLCVPWWIFRRFFYAGIVTSLSWCAILFLVHVKFINSSYQDINWSFWIAACQILNWGIPIQKMIKWTCGWSNLLFVNWRDWVALHYQEKGGHLVF